jgi:hypothetical protein
MTQPLPNVYLDADAVLRAIVGAQCCPDCRPGSRALVIEPSRGQWSVVVRHASTCPRLSKEDQQRADAFWRDLQRTWDAGNAG